MMNHLYLFALMGMFSISVFGQSAYFETDSVLIVGASLIDSGDKINARYCKVKISDSITFYTPWQIRAYGFKGGPEFFSKEIVSGDSTTRVFLQRLHKGETSLYYYRGKGIRTFFVETDSTFVEVSKRDDEYEKYNELLLQITKDCPNVVEAIHRVGYNKRAFSKLFERYENCESKPFPRFKFGLALGYEFSTITPTAEFGYNFNHHNNYNGGVSIGLFVNKPILMSYFSFHTEILFSQQRHNYYHLNTNEHMHVSLQMSSFKIPLLIRYSLPINNFRPFINTGTILSHNAIQKSTSFIASVSDNIVSINKPIELSLLSANQAGYMAGLGFEYDIGFKKTVFIEMRYSRQFSIFHNNPVSIISALFMSSGISF